VHTPRVNLGRGGLVQISGQSREEHLFKRMPDQGTGKRKRKRKSPKKTMIGFFFLDVGMSLLDNQRGGVGEKDSLGRCENSMGSFCGRRKKGRGGGTTRTSIFLESVGWGPLLSKDSKRTAPVLFWRGTVGWKKSGARREGNGEHQKSVEGESTLLETADKAKPLQEERDPA